MNFEGRMDAFIGKVKKKRNNEREVVKCAKSRDVIRDLFENQGQCRVTFLDLFFIFHSRRALVILKV